MRIALHLACLTWAAFGLGAEPEVIRREVPTMPSIELKSVGKLNLKLVPECSALWVSPSQPGVFWTLADSGAATTSVTRSRSARPPGACQSIAWPTDSPSRALPTGASTETRPVVTSASCG